MADEFSAECFVNSAREFAQSAVDAHSAKQYRRLAIDAAAALEHLAKACLAKRSPVLLTELRREESFQSMLLLLGLSERIPARRLRTVGLRDALARVRLLVKTRASEDDLQTLVDIRDGTIHAAQNDEMEDRIVVAFVQHADALLADVGHDRAEFWGGRLAVVDALLADASDQVAHRVAVKLAAARANFQRQYGQVAEELLHVVRQLAEFRTVSWGQERAACPACGSAGVAGGFHHVDWDFELDEETDRYRTTGHGVVWFSADRFACSVCRLQLDSASELTAAGMDEEWEVAGADPSDYDTFDLDEDAAYEARREDRLG
jgi:hypothetical protein